MSERELVPEGYYEAVAVGIADESGNTTYATMAYAGKDKTKQAVVLFQILSGPMAGRRLPWYGFFTSAAGPHTVESLRLMGFQGDDLMTLGTQPLDQRVSIKVRHNEWQGKISARVEFVNAPGGARMKINDPMPADEVRKFAAMMRSTLAGIPERKGERAGAPPTSPNPSSAEPINVMGAMGEIPF